VWRSYEALTARRPAARSAASRRRAARSCARNSGVIGSKSRIVQSTPLGKQELGVIRDQSTRPPRKILAHSSRPLQGRLLVSQRNENLGLAAARIHVDVRGAV